MVGSWHCVLCQSASQSDGTWEPDGISGKYDGCYVLWVYLCSYQEAFCDMYGRDDRNWYSRSTSGVSGGKTFNGSRASRAVCLYYSIYDINCGREHLGLWNTGDTGKGQNFGTVTESEIGYGQRCVDTTVTKDST